MSLDRRGGFGADYSSEPHTSVYATAVYNDESHTFEQVIQALQRSLDVGSREAVDLATCIDREGRSIVRCSSFHVRTEFSLGISNFHLRFSVKLIKKKIEHDFNSFKIYNSSIIH